MHRYVRVRHVLKWIGLGFSVLITTSWAVSIFCVVSMRIGVNSWLMMNNGMIAGGVLDIRFSWLHDKSFDLRKRRLKFPEVWTAGIREDVSANEIEIWVPHWFALAAIAFPTAWLWHRDRRSQRIGPGCCVRCSYDLTSNTSGVCPECGFKPCPPAVSAVSQRGMSKPPNSTV